MRSRRTFRTVFVPLVALVLIIGLGTAGSELPAKPLIVPIENVELPIEAAGKLNLYDGTAKPANEFLPIIELVKKNLDTDLILKGTQGLEEPGTGAGLLGQIAAKAGLEKVVLKDNGGKGEVQLSGKPVDGLDLQGKIELEGTKQLVGLQSGPIDEEPALGLETAASFGEGKYLDAGIEKLAHDAGCGALG